MSLSFYTRIKTELIDAFDRSFFSVTPLPSVPVTFSSITPDRSIDIATPFPLRVSRHLDLPLSTVSEKLLANFHFENNFITNTAENLFYKGFFNFRLRTSLIFQSVYNACQFELSQLPMPKHTPDIVLKIVTLLKRYSSEKTEAYTESIWQKLNTQSYEFRVSRFIALSGEDALHSDGAREYFKNRLIAEACLFYKSCPVITEDPQLSELRTLIFKAIYYRYQTLTTV